MQNLKCPDYCSQLSVLGPSAADMHHETRSVQMNGLLSVACE